MRTLFAAIIIMFLVEGQALSCAGPYFEREILMRVPPFRDDTSTDIAYINVKDILSRTYSLASVSSRLNGFDGVDEFLIYSGDGTCNIAPKADDIGSKFVVAGQLVRRDHGRPVFIGSWSMTGHPMSKEDFEIDRDRIKLFAPD